mmetsp:Transcript_57571/g.135486  ORF Transcript_57571/g.135486 Transcript_57571/m.135486 type:complete len:326 (-) Transcript_57571:80-1057(-)
MMLRTSVLISALTVASCFPLPSGVPDQAMETEFAAFQDKFNVTYGDEDERAWRFSVFRYNMEQIIKLQEQHPLAQFGVTQFSDYTPDEFQALQGLRPNERFNDTEVITQAELPRGDDAVDWRDKGLVTEVKNQKRCGSCWAFGTTGVIEGAWAKAGNKLTSLSESEFVDCDSNDDGCKGGSQGMAMRYALNQWNGHIDSEEDYPYHAKPLTCHRKKRAGAVLKSHKFVESSEGALADAVSAHGPITIGVDTDRAWQHYHGGVICDSTKSIVDHAVLVVGYDKTAHPPYWIIKNSWGHHWGEQGYIKVAMHKGCYGVGSDSQAAFC